MRTSKNYICTVDKNADGMAKIEELRQTIRAVNHIQREYAKGTGETAVLYRVSLRGRLGRNNPSAKKYQNLRKHYRGYGAHPYQTIKLADAARIDVYVYEQR